MSAPARYSRTQIVLHWVIAALVVVQLTLNGDMQQAFAQRLASGAIPANAGAIVHAALGLLVLALAVIRLVIRLARGVPDAPPGNTKLVTALGHATHLLLYAFLFAMPITGALAWFAGIETAAILHELARLILIPAILLHVAGAIVEQVVLGHKVIQRMSFGRPSRSGPAQAANSLRRQGESSRHKTGR